MRARQLGIDRQGFLEFGLGCLVKLEADHHLGREHVRRRRVGRDAKRRRQRRSRLVRLRSLDVGHAEHLCELDVVGGPRPGLLQQRHGLLQSSGEVVRETEHLNGFPAFERSLRQGVRDGSERLDRACGIVAMVIRDAGEIPDMRVVRRELLQLFERPIELTRIDRRTNVG
jgi:hypothetical protein